MLERAPRGMANVEQVGGFDAIIDARAPAEFAEDHLPDGAKHAGAE